MKKIFLLFVLLCSCESQQKTQQFIYMKDTRTNICYATYDLGWNWGSLTAVPCSEEVEKQIQLNASK